MREKSLYIFCFTLFVCSFSRVQSQDVAWKTITKEDMANVFEQLSNWFKNSSAYSFTVTHVSYENYKTIVPYEKSVGYFKRDKNNYHSFLLGIHTIQNKKYKISVDTASKIIMVANTDSSIWDTYKLDDYKVLLESCATIKMFNQTTDKRYRLEFREGYPLSSYEFLIASNGVLKEITWYYAKEVQKDPDDEHSQKVKPRLSITFSDYKKNPVFNYKNEFDESAYFLNKGNKLVVTEKYKKFEISDQRLILN